MHAKKRWHGRVVASAHACLEPPAHLEPCQEWTLPQRRARWGWHIATRWGWHTATYPRKSSRLTTFLSQGWHLCMSCFLGTIFLFFSFFASLESCKYGAATASCGTRFPMQPCTLQICLQLFALNLPPALLFDAPEVLVREGTVYNHSLFYNEVTLF